MQPKVVLYAKQAASTTTRPETAKVVQIDDRGRLLGKGGA